jgi:molecular chaperone HtpG
MDREYQQPKMVLELNARHPLLRSLVQLPEPSEILDLCVEQLFDAALLLEGLHPDPAGIVPRLQELMQAAVAKSTPAE